MGLLDFLGTTDGDMFANPQAMGMFNAGLGMMNGAQGQPGGYSPSFGQAALGGMNGYSSGYAGAQDAQMRNMQVQLAKQKMEDEQRKREAVFGTPWTNPDTGATDPNAGGLINDLPPEYKALATAAPDEFLKAVMEQAYPKAQELSSDEKGYERAKSQGYPGTWMQYKAELAQSMRPQTNVNVNNDAPFLEREFDKALGKDNAETYIGINKEGREAGDNVAKYSRLGELLSSPGVYQGAGGEQVLQAQKLASGLGMKVEGAGPAQAAQAISRGLALELRNPASGAGMPGAMSDADREYLKSLVAGVNNTPEGNKILIDAKIKVEKRKLEIAKMARKYQAKHGRFDQTGFYDELQAWSDKNPLFGGNSNSEVDDLINKYK